MSRFRAGNRGTSRGNGRFTLSKVLIKSFISTAAGAKSWNACMTSVAFGCARPASSASSFAAPPMR
ncbi:hypothetical protein CCR75_001103 [Bremia lactucae]|uniref:Uncharacterized protein n=1 Tax=Bremia lactucae TaxID=4779 RepID=A0A976IH03_BRELC|nr:hypothetical protein CCR75_001103 [Bremia lactucae]